MCGTEQNQPPEDCKTRTRKDAHVRHEDSAEGINALSTVPGQVTIKGGNDEKI